MPTLRCRLVKITPQKNLMVRVTDKTHEIVTERALAFSKKEFGEIAKIPSWTSEGQRPSLLSHFFFLSLDKYDRQNLSHYEWHLRKDMVIDYKFTPYTNGKPGVNMMLNSMWKWSGPSLFEQPRDQYKRLDSDDSEQEDDEGIMRKVETSRSKRWADYENELFAEAAAKAEARETSTETKLNPEEKAIDDEVEARVAERFNLPAIAGAYVPMAPRLERQNGIIGYSGAATRDYRRRATKQ